MPYEYKVVPAPVRGLKAKGLKTSEERFANALEAAINDLAADGWEYLRADTLPCEKREGIMGKTTVFQNMLVFRRVKMAKPLSAKAEPQLTATRKQPDTVKVTPRPDTTPADTDEGGETDAPRKPDETEAAE